MSINGEHNQGDLDHVQVHNALDEYILALFSELAPYPGGTPVIGEAVVVTQASPLVLGFGSASGVNTLANQAPGTPFYVTYDGTNWKDTTGTTLSARPSSRTDLMMICVNAHDASVPSWGLTGTDVLWRIA